MSGTKKKLRIGRKKQLKTNMFQGKCDLHSNHLHSAWGCVFTSVYHHFLCFSAVSCWPFTWWQTHWANGPMPSAELCQLVLVQACLCAGSRGQADSLPALGGSGALCQGRSSISATKWEWDAPVGDPHFDISLWIHQVSKSVSQKGVLEYTGRMNFCWSPPGTGWKHHRHCGKC